MNKHSRRVSFTLANRFFGRRTCFENYEYLRKFLKTFFSFNVQSRASGKGRAPLISTGQLDLNQTVHGYRLANKSILNENSEIKTIIRLIIIV